MSATPAKSTAEDLSRRADELTQVRLDELIEEVSQVRNEFQAILGQRRVESAGKTHWDVQQEDLTPILENFARLPNRVTRLKGELERIQQVVDLRRADIQLQTSVLAAVPNDSVSALLIYASIATIGGGGVAYGLSRFPSVGYALIPALVVWAFGIALFVIGYWNLNRWQHWKENLFHDRLGIPRLPRRRWHLWDRHAE